MKVIHHIKENQMPYPTSGLSSSSSLVLHKSSGPRCFIIVWCSDTDEWKHGRLGYWRPTGRRSISSGIYCKISYKWTIDLGSPMNIYLKNIWRHFIQKSHIILVLFSFMFDDICSYSNIDRRLPFLIQSKSTNLRIMNGTLFLLS